ncbi:MAG TPA: DUF2723 domain-containing protein [Gaiellaceae bacterium]|jgi:hypothetical protein|nr:DUF2723 domain-containing protein [Gaiellaceae bacterium]
MANKRKRTQQRRAAATVTAPPVVAQAPAASKPGRPAPRVAARTAAPSPPRDWMPFAAAAAVAIVAFVIYALTVEHTVPTGDSGELIATAYVLGVAHPPGYPLWTMLGHLASVLPGGSVALRVNLMSGFFDAIAVGLVFLTIYRLATYAGTGRKRLAYVAATTGALLLAFSSIFWAYSVVAEVFALNNFLAALMLLLAFEWARHPERMRLLWVFTFVLGLSLTNQQTIVLFVPAFVVLAWRGWLTLTGGTRVAWIRLAWSLGVVFVLAEVIEAVARGWSSLNIVLLVLTIAYFGVVAWLSQSEVRRRRATWPGFLPSSGVAIAAGTFVAGLLPLLYLPIAASTNPAMNWGDPSSLSAFKALILRQNYGTGTLVVGGKRGSYYENMRLLFGNLTSGFVIAGVVLALLGLWWAWRHRRAEGISLVTAFVVAGPLFMLYTDTAYPDELTKGIIARFYILPSIPLAIAAGLGSWWLLEKAAPVRLVRPGLVAAVVSAALLLVPFASAVRHYSTADESGNHVAEDYAHDLLATLPPNSLLLMRGDENLTSVSYVQNVEHFRPDVIALDTELLKLPSYVSQARRDHPALLIPFAKYDGGVTTSLNTFVADNIPQRPVFYIGTQVEKKFGQPFDQVIEGLTRRLEAKGSAPDMYAVLAQNPKLYALHYPSKRYPKTSWEGEDISTNYAYEAFYDAYAIETEGTTAEVPLGEKMYATAIRLYPGLTQAYKDYGLMLNDHGGDPKQIIPLWQTYLRLAPHDPQAPAIRKVLNHLIAEQK